MKLQFTLVCGTTPACQETDLQISEKIREFVDKEWKGTVYIKSVFLDKKKNRRQPSEEDGNNR